MGIPKNYLKWSVLYHLDSSEKIKPILDYEIVIKDGTCAISSLASLRCIFDVDLTLTIDNTVFEEFYYRQLPEVNPNIRRNIHVMMEIIRDIGKSYSDFIEPHARLDNFFRKCELRKEQVIEASVRTGESKNIKIVPYAFEAINEIEKMNCKVGLNTGSVKTAVEEVSRRKIGIEATNIAATKFFYDEKGVFLKSWLNLGKNKEISMSTYFLPEAYCNFSFTINPNWPKIVYVADKTFSHFEKYVAAKVGSSSGIVLEVGENLPESNEEYEYVVNALEIKKDLRKIKPYLELIRRATIYPFLIRPEEAYEAIKLADEIKFSKFENLEEFLNKIQDFLSTEILFPTLATRIDKKCKELKRKLKDNDLKKEEVEEVVNILKSFDPAFHTKEKRKRELKEIVLSSTYP
ncbi:MAG: HAD family hydrolase [Candidatus Aenigmatarchaeota archaeon]